MCKLLTSCHCVFLISLCCHFASLSLAFLLCLQAIFLPGPSQGNYSGRWEGETTSSLTQTYCYKFTLFWGGYSPTLTPSLPQYIWPANKMSDTLDSNTQQTQTQPLLTYLGGQERTHAALRNRDCAVTCGHNWLIRSFSFSGANTPQSNLVKWA